MSFTQDHVVSVRMDYRLLAEIRILAAQDEVAVSDWIRRAASVAAFERSKPRTPPGFRVVGWRCPHLTMTASGTTTGPVISGCGCEMHPVLVSAA